MEVADQFGTGFNNNLAVDSCKLAVSCRLTVTAYPIDRIKNSSANFNWHLEIISTQAFKVFTLSQKKNNTYLITHFKRIFNRRTVPNQ